MIKDLNIFWQLFKLNIKKSLIYRINFLITLWGMFLWIGLYVAFFELLFNQVDSMAGWTKGEAMLFLAFYYFIQGIGNIFYRESFENFSEEVRRGTLDQVITKPASTQILSFFKNIRFDHTIDLAVTALLFIYIATQTDTQFSIPFLILGMLLAFFGNILFYGILLMVSSIIFIADRIEGLGSMIWHMSQVTRYPRQIYTGFGKLIFQFIFPVALMASIPAEVTLRQSDLSAIGYFIGFSLLFLLLGNISFRLGLKRYNSAN
jgi:ABC-2 type transport system permease protein